MSLISDPWDDEDLEVDRLESRLRQVRTVQHRSYSTWNDSTTTNRPVLQPVEVKPAVRIMKRDTTAESSNKKDESEVVQQSLADKEKAYAEARQRILGIPDTKPPKSDPSDIKRGGQSGRGNHRGNKQRGRYNRGGQNNTYDERSNNSERPNNPRSNRSRGRVNGYRGRGRGRPQYGHEGQNT